MIELWVWCEGATEEGFVRTVLAPHLRQRSVFPVAKRATQGGGAVKFQTLKRVIQQSVGNSRSHQFTTTMYDLYALPEFPGNERRPGESTIDRVLRIESKMAQGLPNPRFIPYIQVHEFEALILADVESIERAFPEGDAKDVPERLRDLIGTTPPEEVNDGRETAPSKRIIRAFPGYERVKSIDGPRIVASIGIERLRERCPHFGSWITRLENLAVPSAP